MIGGLFGEDTYSHFQSLKSLFLKRKYLQGYKQMETKEMENKHITSVPQSTLN